MQTRQVFTAYGRDSAETGPSYRYCPVCATPLPAPNETAPHQKCPCCTWVHYRNPAPGVVILIADGDRVLIGKRAESSYAPGKWCLPGGFIEFDEDFLTAAIREVKEETGYDVEITSILSVMSNFLRPGLHTLVVVLEASIISGEPSPGDDIVELGWFPLDGPFPDMAFDADHHIIMRYRKTNLSGAPIDHEYARQSVR
jgi:8-oxo-dGTP diphosphatase